MSRKTTAGGHGLVEANAESRGVLDSLDVGNEDGVDVVAKASDRNARRGVRHLLGAIELLEDRLEDALDLALGVRDIEATDRCAEDRDGALTVTGPCQPNRDTLGEPFDCVRCVGRLSIATFGERGVDDRFDRPRNLTFIPQSPRVIPVRAGVPYQGQLGQRDGRTGIRPADRRPRRSET